MKYIIAVFILLHAWILRAEDAQKGICYSVDDWNATVSAMKDFDEIRMTLATQAVRIPKKVTADKIEYETHIQRDALIFFLPEIKDSGDFLRLLQFKPDVPMSSCGCYGLFDISFYRKGQLVGSLHYAHGHYWCPVTDVSQRAINLWLDIKGFPIQETLKKDTQKANQALQHNDPSCHESCLRTPRASRGRG